MCRLYNVMLGSIAILPYSISEVFAFTFMLDKQVDDALVSIQFTVASTAAYSVFD